MTATSTEPGSKSPDKAAEPATTVCRFCSAATPLTATTMPPTYPANPYPSPPLERDHLPLRRRTPASGQSHPLLSLGRLLRMQRRDETPLFGRFTPIFPLITHIRHESRTRERRGSDPPIAQYRPPLPLQRPSRQGLCPVRHISDRLSRVAGQIRQQTLPFPGVTQKAPNRPNKARVYGAVRSRRGRSESGCSRIVPDQLAGQIDQGNGVSMGYSTREEQAIKGSHVDGRYAATQPQLPQLFQQYFTFFVYYTATFSP